MKKAKRILLVLVCVILSFVTVFTMPVSAVDNAEGYGTPEDGIIPTVAGYQNRHDPYPGDGFGNFDFHDGFMYFTTPHGKKVSDIAVLGKDGNDTYVQFHDIEEKYEGFSSIRFMDSRIKVGDYLVTIYEWQSTSHNFQVYLNQSNSSNIHESRLTHRFNNLRDEEEVAKCGWNLTMSESYYPVSEPLHGAPIMITMGIQAFQDINCTAKIKNIRIGKIDPKTKKVYDLDGNFLYEDGKMWQNDANTDTIDDKNTIDETKDGTKNNTTIVSKKDNNKTGLDNATKIAIALSAVAVVIVIIVIVVIIVSNKKPKAKKE